MRSLTTADLRGALVGYCSECSDPIDMLFYNEDGREICETCWEDHQVDDQAEDDLADAASDMPRWDGD